MPRRSLTRCLPLFLFKFHICALFLNIYSLSDNACFTKPLIGLDMFEISSILTCSLPPLRTFRSTTKAESVYGASFQNVSHQEAIVLWERRDPAIALGRFGGILKWHCSRGLKCGYNVYIILALRYSFSTHFLEWEELTIFELLLDTWHWVEDFKYIISFNLHNSENWVLFQR